MKKTKTEKKQTPPLITISELSRLWRKDRGTIRRVLHLAEIEPEKHDGKSGFYSLEDARTALDAHFGRVTASKPAATTPGEELKRCLLRLGAAVIELDKLAMANPETFGWIANLTERACGILLALRNECVADGHFDE